MYALARPFLLHMDAGAQPRPGAVVPGRPLRADPGRSNCCTRCTVAAWLPCPSASWESIFPTRWACRRARQAGQRRGGTGCLRLRLGGTRHRDTAAPGGQSETAHVPHRIPGKAVINRMGFNSIGLEGFLTNLRGLSRGVIRGINIGKNAATPGGARGRRTTWPASTRCTPWPITSRSTSPRRIPRTCVPCRKTGPWTPCWRPS